jgi:hypothetical protein
LFERIKQFPPRTQFHIEGFFIVKYAWGEGRKQPD